MFITGSVCFTILLLLELRALEGLFYGIRGLIRRCCGKQTVDSLNLSTDDALIDTDVQIEKDRVKEMSDDVIASNNLVLRNMTKIYNKFVAVNQLSIAVDQ